MKVLGWIIQTVAGSLDALGLTFTRSAKLLQEFLPAVLPPDQLSRQIPVYYRKAYTSQPPPTEAELADDGLEMWEADVLNRYRIGSGHLLAMGTGWGREALALARRGLTVFAVEIDPVAVRTAQRFARRTGLSAHFHRASFTALPFADNSFDVALLSSTMYSAIPGSRMRQAWLADLVRLLKRDGLAILSFERELPPPSRLRTWARPVNALLHRLPGANHAYEPGDTYTADHYMHAFRHETEMRQELSAAGVQVRELNWMRGYAVVTAHRTECGPVS
jgi:ubiquinone/menaquinone biosynthesis C-methylase UbiE